MGSISCVCASSRYPALPPAPYGGKQRAEHDPIRAGARGVSPAIVDALVRQNVILPAGDARLGGIDYDILINGSPDTAADFNSLPVPKSSIPTQVYLGDVAHVSMFRRSAEHRSRVNGKQMTYLAILKKENASTFSHRIRRSSRASSLN